MCASSAVKASEMCAYCARGDADKDINSVLRGMFDIDGYVGDMLRRPR